MRTEEAAELLASIRYTLLCQCAAQGLPENALLTHDLAALFAAGQRTVLAILEQAKALYGAALQHVRTFGSRSLADTLRGIGGFFARYNARLYAQLIPGDIDYQLCLPVPDEPAGVLWVLDYLTRLHIENGLLQTMDETRVVRLLRRVHPHYGELLVSLYEPVAANVVGLSLLGGGEGLLEISPAQGARIYAQLSALPAEEGPAALAQAARDASARLRLTDGAQVAYLTAAARALYPRLMASPEAYRGVFAVAPMSDATAITDAL
jgi:hypothetical protein